MRRIFVDWQGNNKAKVYIFEGSKGHYELVSLTDLSPDLNLSGPAVVYLNLPLERLNFRILEFPFNDIKKVKDVLPFELASRMLHDIHEIIVDAVTIGENGEKTTVLAVCVHKPVLEEVLGIAVKLQVNPRFVTATGLRSIISDFSPEKLTELSSPGDDEYLSLIKQDMHDPIVNFRRGEFAYKQDAKVMGKTFRLSVLLVGLLLFIVCVNMTFKFVTIHQQIPIIREEMEKTYRAMFPEEKTLIDPIYQAKARLKALRDKESTAGILPNEILLTLAGAKVKDIAVNELTMDRNGISIKGEAPVLKSIEVWKRSLEKVFDEVRITDSRSYDNKLIFTVSAKERR